MNYQERDTYGMYKGHNGGGPDVRHGPGPNLMGADTLVGNDVYNKKDEDCWRRVKTEPLRRLNNEPGVEAELVRVGCG